jgi:excisionase family DNA binding protein
MRKRKINRPIATKPPRRAEDRAAPGIGHNHPPPAKSPLDGRVTLRVREVIELTGFSQSTVYEMMDDGLLPNTKVRGIRLIYAEGLRALLAPPAP